MFPIYNNETNKISLLTRLAKGEFIGLLLLILDRNIVSYENEKVTKTDCQLPIDPNPRVSWLHLCDKRRLQTGTRQTLLWRNALTDSLSLNRLLEDLNCRDMQSVKAFHNNVYLVYLQVCAESAVCVCRTPKFPASPGDKNGWAVLN